MSCKSLEPNLPLISLAAVAFVLIGLSSAIQAPKVSDDVVYRTVGSTVGEFAETLADLTGRRIEIRAPAEQEFGPIDYQGSFRGLLDVAAARLGLEVRTGRDGSLTLVPVRATSPYRMVCRDSEGGLGEVRVEGVVWHREATTPNGRPAVIGETADGGRAAMTLDGMSGNFLYVGRGELTCAWGNARSLGTGGGLTR